MKKRKNKNTNEIPEDENIIEQKGFRTIKEEDVYASLSEQKIEKEIGLTIVEIPNSQS